MKYVLSKRRVIKCTDAHTHREVLLYMQNKVLFDLFLLQDAFVDLLI